MGATATGATLSTVRLPRTRVFVVGALIAAAAILVLAFVWGPLGRLNQQQVSPSPGALLSAGLAAQLAGRNSEAVADYQKVLAKDPTNYWAFYNLGVMDQLGNRPASAEANYRRALALNPDFVPALYNLAILRSSVAPAEAENLYRHAIAVQPTSATSHLNLGFLLIREGKKTEGQTELQTAVKLDPSLASRVASPTAGSR